MNDEMVMNRGVERSANPNIERMLNIDLHFATPEEKAMSRICASKARRNLQTVMPVGYTIFCTRKTSRKINTTGRVVLRKNVSEKLSIINPL